MVERLGGGEIEMGLGGGEGVEVVKVRGRERVRL